MPFISPITALNIGIGLSVFVVLVVEGAVLLRKCGHLPDFFEFSSAKEIVRVSIFLMMTQIFIITGFFSWEFFISSEQQSQIKTLQSRRDTSEVRYQDALKRRDMLPSLILKKKQAIARSETELDAQRSGKAEKETALENLARQRTLDERSRYAAEVEKMKSRHALELSRLQNKILERSKSIAMRTTRSITAHEKQVAALGAKSGQNQTAIAAITETIDALRQDLANHYGEAKAEILKETNSRHREELGNLSEEHEQNLEKTGIDLKLSKERLDIKTVVLEEAVSDRKAELIGLESELKNIDTHIATRLSALNNRHDDIKAVENIFGSKSVEEYSKNAAVALRALALGALGAMVTMMISYEREANGKTRVRSIFSYGQFYGLFISHVIRGSVIAAAGYAIVFTDILSFNGVQDVQASNPNREPIPDYWKVTLVCIALGAFSEKIYDAVGARIPSASPDHGGPHSDAPLPTPPPSNKPDGQTGATVTPAPTMTARPLPPSTTSPPSTT